MNLQVFNGSVLPHHHIILPHGVLPHRNLPPPGILRLSNHSQQDHKESLNKQHQNQTGEKLPFLPEALCFSSASPEKGEDERRTEEYFAAVKENFYCLLKSVQSLP